MKIVTRFHLYTLWGRTLMSVTVTRTKILVPKRRPDLSKQITAYLSA